MADFVDREHELAGLEDAYRRYPGLVLLWGRRRVGKSALLQRFAAGKPAVFSQAIEGTPLDQLAQLTARFLEFRADPFLAAAPLANWPQAIAMMERLAADGARAGDGPLIVVLDEFPYYVTSTPELPSLLQDAWERWKAGTLPLILVLAGSQIALFEKHVLLGPLFGRRTFGQQLPPLGYREAGLFFPDYSTADRIRAYAVLGGVPYYLEQFDPDLPLERNIRERILSKGQVLYDEADLFAKEELGGEASTYLSIISAVADGKTRQGEIANAVGIESTAAPRYLNQLARLHVLERSKPAQAPDNARSGLWSVSDGYLRFWFRFVRANITDLEARRVDAVYADKVAPSLDHFVSKPAFESVVRAYTAGAIGVDPDFPARGEVGAWWGQIPDERKPGTRETRSGEIELVVYDGKKLVLAGEAKWHDGLVDTDALAQLLGTVVHAPGYGTHTRLALFARDGFTPQLEERAARDGILLRTAADLYA